MIKIYLDIDGVLLTAKRTRAAPGVAEFIHFITRRYACYWPTTHCKGDSAPALRYLASFLDAASRAKPCGPVRKSVRWFFAQCSAVLKRSVSQC